MLKHIILICSIWSLSFSSVWAGDGGPDIELPSNPIPLPVINPLSDAGPDIT